VEKSLEIIPGAGHLFEEPGVLEVIAEMACDWFERHLVLEKGSESERSHSILVDAYPWAHSGVR
jgi:hypothetical protein